MSPLIKTSLNQHKPKSAGGYMNLPLKKGALASALASVIFVSGCTTTGAPTSSSSSSASSAESARIAELDRRAAELDAREARLNAQASNSASLDEAVANGSDLLPPNAAPGECYARVWVDAEYRTIEEQVLAREASKKIEVIPAQYETVEDSVLVSAASSRLETIPAVYGTETEQVKVRSGEKIWRIGLRGKDAPASQALLAAAGSQVDLTNASVGMCFHEHYVPATYETVTEQVLKTAATETVNIIPAEYQMVEKRILVQEASTKLVQVPAEYESVSEQVVDKPAHTIWKKGRGPIQKIDEATGEIMCLVEVPATYKTLTRTVLKTPASTQTIEVPAVYDTVKVRELVSSASEQRTPVPAVYGTIEKQVLKQDAGFVWHEVSNVDHPASTRTGNQICLTETEDQYKTVSRTVVEQPAQSREIEIPAEYKTVKVTKLVSAAREEVTEIPAEYTTATRRELVKDGYMAWRSILCETNMTRQRIADIQRSLIEKGYDVGGNGADGIIGSSTISAVNAFQRDNDLPVDRYLNIKTVKALGISTQ